MVAQDKQTLVPPGVSIISRFIFHQIDPSEANHVWANVRMLTSKYVKITLTVTIDFQLALHERVSLL